MELVDVSVSIDADPEKMPYDIVLVYPVELELQPDEEGQVNEKQNEQIVGRNEERAYLMAKIKKVGISYDRRMIEDAKKLKKDPEAKLCLVQLYADEERLLIEADRIGMEMKLANGAGYKDFNLEERSLFDVKPGGAFFSSLERQRLIYSILEAQKAVGGAECDLDGCKEEGILADYYSLHSKRREGLFEEWMSLKISQPLDDIRDYFGEKLALYFAWIGHYTSWLIPLALFGLIAQIIIWSVGRGSPFMIFYIICLCLWTTGFLESWKRRNAELAFKWDVQDFEAEEMPRPEFLRNPATKKKAGVYTSSGHFIEMQEGTKSLFLTHIKNSTRKSTRASQSETPAGEDLGLPYFDPGQRIMRMITGSMPIFLMLVSVVIGTLCILMTRWLFTNDRSPLDDFHPDKHKSMAALGSVIAGVINAVFIKIMNAVYKELAVALNAWENHRTETAYEDTLIAKTILFQFINSYMSLFYLAFFKQNHHFFGIKKLGPDSCKPAKGSDVPDCLGEMEAQLLSLTVITQFVGLFTEVCLPYIIKKIKGALAAEGEKSKLELEKENDAVLQELELPTYAGTFNEFNEMIIQFGYISMFASAFPFSAVSSFINNIFEIKGDALNVLYRVQRPRYAGAQDIGTWGKVLEIFGYIAVFTNSFILAFASPVFQSSFPTVFKAPLVLDPEGKGYGDDDNQRILNTNWLYKLIFAVTMEHILLALKFAIAEAIPDKPEAVEQAEAIQQLRKEAAVAGVHQKADLSAWGDDSELDAFKPPVTTLST